MGYAATTVVVLGTGMEHEQAKRLMDAIKARMAPMGLDPEGMDLNGVLGALGYPVGDMECVCAADGADSRSDNVSGFDDSRCFEYAAGLHIASSGYGGGADIPQAIKGCARPDWIDEFERGMGQLIADSLGVAVEPEALVVTQVW